MQSMEALGFSASPTYETQDSICNINAIYFGLRVVLSKPLLIHAIRVDGPTYSDSPVELAIIPLAKEWYLKSMIAQPT
jgi:hypothetical protein